MSMTSEHYSVPQLITDAHAVLARTGATETALRELGALVARLAAVPGLIPERELTAMHGTDSTATVLHSDGTDGITLVLAQFSDQEETPIHDHNAWGVACVVQGRDRYRQWERIDDGSFDDHAELRLLYERELAPGDIVLWPDPPHDIHSQQGIGGPAWELILFGKNAMALPRHYFDRATGTVRVAMPQ